MPITDWIQARDGSNETESFYCWDAVDVLKHDCPENYIDLIVTSPPYDNLRNYNGFSFDAGSMLSAIFRVTTPGGVCVWVVGEKINGGRSLSSFNHAFAGRDCGFVVIKDGDTCTKIC